VVTPAAGSKVAWTPAVADQAPPCPICGGVDFKREFEAKDYEYGFPGIFYVATCNRCRLEQQSPRPPFDQILRYYSSEYRPFANEEDGLVARIKHVVINRPRLRRYQKLVPGQGSVLDVGCGNGALLRMLAQRTDWRLRGIEPSAEAAAAGAAAGLDILATTLEEARFADDSFDLTILNHVLEHVPDPVSTLAELRRIIKPGGYLYGEVPNPACAEQWIFGRYWGGYHLPRHLYFFRRKQLHELLTAAGFVVEKVDGKMQPASVLVSASNYLRERWPSVARLGLFSENSFLWLGVATPFAYVLQWLGSAPTLRFVCKRPPGDVVPKQVMRN
jgi:SAM-dependent methyltransferase